MTEFFGALLLFFGSVFCLVAAIGVLRMPDLLIRMHAATKAGTLGISLILLGAALYLASILVWIKVILAILFLFITSPIAAHMLARAAYFMGTPRFAGTLVDELKDDHVHHTEAGKKN